MCADQGEHTRGHPVGELGATRRSSHEQIPMPHRILIVEDEVIIGLDLKGALEAAGFEPVGIACDMFAALRFAEATAVDLATVDVRLARGTNGVDTAVTLWTKHAIPSLFVSSSLDPDTRVRAAAAQPVGFIDKSYGTDRVVAVVQAHCAGKGRQRRL